MDLIRLVKWYLKYALFSIQAVMLCGLVIAEHYVYSLFFRRPAPKSKITLAISMKIGYTFNCRIRHNEKLIDNAYKKYVALAKSNPTGKGDDNDTGTKVSTGTWVRKSVPKFRSEGQPSWETNLEDDSLV
jgi:hypothetical protein